MALKRIPGSARQYKDTKTGKILSRRQADKIRRSKGKIKPRAHAPQIRRKQKAYDKIVSEFIEKKKISGKKIGRRQARQSDELKQVIKWLKGKNPQNKKKALQKLTRGMKVTDWKPYLKRWKQEAEAA